MDVFEAILKRRSIRAFLNKKITDEQIKILLEAAMAAPSARNQQAWQFYVIKDKKIQAEIRNASRYYNFNSPLMIIVAGNKNKLKKDDDFWIQDCSAATQNILLAATHLNLGTCWSGIYPNLDAVEVIKNILNLTDEIIPLSLIHIGYSDEEKEARTQYLEENVKVI